jgi:hypothetical protein
MGCLFVLVLLLLPLPLSVHAEDLGKLSANPFNEIPLPIRSVAGIPSRTTA